MPHLIDSDESGRLRFEVRSKRRVSSEDGDDDSGSDQRGPRNAFRSSFCLNTPLIDPLKREARVRALLRPLEMLLELRNCTQFVKPCHADRLRSENRTVLILSVPRKKCMAGEAPN